MTLLTGIGGLFVLVLSTNASAQNLYMNDMKLKSELEWLNAQGVTHISTSTWPLTANEINNALTAAQVTTDTQQKVLQSVLTMLESNPNSLAYCNLARKKSLLLSQTLLPTEILSASPPNE